ncbi:DUF427 domain-containing protein [Neolewinella litorea]|uniref:DUF427 domain-containing protein n=1 Tax=Neolewinella litorea TaxID=2562452 RepID=A0A4S4NU05_9BACT|nr:DUF427 domain-containing protein [Neolewinella litorea]THH39720.1 DUF427 domain-containing protein [Neolewinella litorea]
MIKATWKGQVLAESDRTQVVEGNHYFPPDSVRLEYFKDSDTTTFCGWKGDCRYYHVVVDGNTNPDAAWYYPDPYPKAAQIKGHVAFWKGVQIQ